MSIPFDPPRPRPSGGGGGAAGFTPVLFNGQWASNIQQPGYRAVIPETITDTEGITSGNGTEGTPYGWTNSPNPTNVGSESYWKVSEEMAGIYTITMSYNISRYGSESGRTDNHTPPAYSIRNSITTNSRRLIAPNNNGVVNTSNEDMILQTSTVTARMFPEDRMAFTWGNTNFTLRGGNATAPGAWMSITKVSN